MYADDDPYLPELRRICLALPEATEVESWGRPTFRAGKMFAIFSALPEAPFGVIFKPAPEEMEALRNDPRFQAAPYYDPASWIALDFEAADVDWGEVAELMDASYRQVALKRMIAALDRRPAQM